MSRYRCCSSTILLILKLKILCICGENGLDKFWNSGISQFKNEASSKTKMDGITNFMDL